MLIVVSAPIGSGKTTLCQKLAGSLRQRGYPVAGVLTPAIVEGGKVGIQAVDLRSGETRLLARTDRDLGGTRLGRYTFDDRTLDWMASRCEDALAGDREVVFVDEIGRLELERGRGLAWLIPLLSRPRRGYTVAVVRDTLLDEFTIKVKPVRPRIVSFDAGCRDPAWSELTALLLSAGIEPGECRSRIDENTKNKEAQECALLSDRITLDTT